MHSLVIGQIKTDEKSNEIAAIPELLIGPRCTIATPNHAKDAATRLAGWECASPATIGSNVWFGSNVTVTPGVTIGSNSIIGAGSVVTHYIPENSIAVGDPARVIR